MEPELKVIGFFESGQREHRLEEIGRSDRSAGAFLCRLLRDGTFFDTVGERSEVLLPTDGDELVSCCGAGRGKR